MQSHVNVVAEPNRFIILHDSVRVMDAASRTAAFEEVALPALQDMHLLYSGSAADVSAASGPSIWVMALSTEATNTPSLAGSFRLLYLDN